jgi:hypothetical protein
VRLQWFSTVIQSGTDDREEHLVSMHLRFLAVTSGLTLGGVVLIRTLVAPDAGGVALSGRGLAFYPVAGALMALGIGHTLLRWWRFAATGIDRSQMR